MNHISNNNDDGNDNDTDDDNCNTELRFEIMRMWILRAEVVLTNWEHWVLPNG